MCTSAVGNCALLPSRLPPETSVQHSCCWCCRTFNKSSMPRDARCTLDIAPPSCRVGAFTLAAGAAAPSRQTQCSTCCWHLCVAATHLVRDVRAASLLLVLPHLQSKQHAMRCTLRFGYRSSLLQGRSVHSCRWPHVTLAFLFLFFLFLPTFLLLFSLFSIAVASITLLLLLKPPAATSPRHETVRS